MSESSQSSQWAWHHSLVCEIVVWSSELNVFAGTITEFQMGWTKVGFDYEIILFDLSVALHQSVSISQIFLLFHSYCDHNLQNELCVLSNVVQIKSVGSSHRPASTQVSPWWLLTSMQVQGAETTCVGSSSSPAEQFETLPHTPLHGGSA